MSHLYTSPLRRALRIPTTFASSSRHFNTSHRVHDFPFKPPPIRERLRPLIPFFIWWTILTSLTVHLLRARQAATEADSRSEAKIHALTDLLVRARAGEEIAEEEVQRRLEMVGVRERSRLEPGDVRPEVRDVGWREAVFGRRGTKTEKEDEEDVESWARSGESLVKHLRYVLFKSGSMADVSVVADASGASAAPAAKSAVTVTSTPVSSAGIRRAPSSDRYM